MLSNRMQMAASAGGAYAAGGSVQFTYAGQEYLERTHGGDGNLRKSAVSIWFKRISISAESRVWGTVSANPYTRLAFNPSNVIIWEHYDSGWRHDLQISGMTFTSTSSWVHLLWHYDADNATQSSRFKAWIDGSAVTVAPYGDGGWPAQYTDEIHPRSSYPMRIGNSSGTSTNNFAEARLSEVAVFDGYLPDITDVRDSVTGLPKDLSGLSFGTYGSWHDMKVPPGTGTGAGTDVSGNGNHYTDSGGMTSGDWSGSDYPGA